MKETVLKEFDDSKLKFSDFKDKMELLISELLKSESIIVHQINGRVKERVSLEKKIERKNNKYNNISEITDVIGIRIITYLESDVNKVAEILKREFTLDPINSIDKRNLKADQFGYRSLHYVVSCNDERTKLVEYKRFFELKFEIQIRSILQHAWAEIEHDLGYKGVASIPDAFKRSFNRVAALLESADIEFDRLKGELNKYEVEIDNLIENNPEDVSLDQTSLISLVKSDETLNEAKNIVAENFNCIFINSHNYGDEIKLFKEFFNINTILELKKSLMFHKTKFLSFVNIISTVWEPYKTLNESDIIYYYQHYLACIDENLEKINEYLKLSNIHADANEFFDIAKKINVENT